MIVIGVDPGLARLGYGVIEVTKEKYGSSSYGCLETSAKGSRSFGAIIKNIYSSRNPF